MTQAPFTRYNLLSIRLSNRFDNRLYRVYKHSTGCQTRLTTAATGLTTGCIVYTAGCQTGCTTGLTTGCIVQTGYQQTKFIKTTTAVTLSNVGPILLF